ncbi:hypothetical protein C0991_005382 [Blastosporella zonata]|nr:hypothetical protein C0991_005382 [Blastosporella zonata]
MQVQKETVETILGTTDPPSLAQDNSYLPPHKWFRYAANKYIEKNNPYGLTKKKRTETRKQRIESREQRERDGQLEEQLPGRRDREKERFQAVTQNNAAGSCRGALMPMSTPKPSRNDCSILPVGTVILSISHALPSSPQASPAGRHPRDDDGSDIEELEAFPPARAPQHRKSAHCSEVNEAILPNLALTSQSKEDISRPVSSYASRVVEVDSDIEEIDAATFAASPRTPSRKGSRKQKACGLDLLSEASGHPYQPRHIRSRVSDEHNYPKTRDARVECLTNKKTADDLSDLSGVYPEPQTAPFLNRPNAGEKRKDREETAEEGEEERPKMKRKIEFNIDSAQANVTDAHETFVSAEPSHTVSCDQVRVETPSSSQTPDLGPEQTLIHAYVLRDEEVDEENKVSEATVHHQAAFFPRKSVESALSYAWEVDSESEDQVDQLMDDADTRGPTTGNLATHRLTAAMQHQLWLNMVETLRRSKM